MDQVTLVGYLTQEDFQAVGLRALAPEVELGARLEVIHGAVLRLVHLVHLVATVVELGARLEVTHGAVLHRVALGVVLELHLGVRREDPVVDGVVGLMICMVTLIGRG